MKHSGPKFHIDYQDFLLEVHVVGYRTKGEAIVVLFKEKDKTFYALAIDNYYKKYKGIITDRTKEILDGNGVKCLPLFIMTHPHEDHIKGMDLNVEAFCNGDSRFYYPSRSFDIDKRTVKLTPKEKIILKRVRGKNKKTGIFSNPVGVASGGYNELRTVYLYDTDDPEEEMPLPIEIAALTPVSSINDKKAVNSTLDPNDLSITIIINIREYYLLFGADVTNDHIELLDANTMAAVKFVKIPHHASNTANKLTGFFYPHQLDYACSTSFHTGNTHLPLDTVLKSYKKVSQRVDVVGCPSKDKHKGLYGEMCYQFKLGAVGMITTVKENGVTKRI